MAQEEISQQEQEQLIKQYEILRDELETADAQNYKVTAGVFAASSAIIAVGLKELEGVDQDHLIKYWFCFLIFLASMSISIPGYRMLIGNRKRIWRIAAYLDLFVEPSLKMFKWESRLQKMRKKENEDKAERAKKEPPPWYKKLYRKTIVASSDVIANEILLMAFFSYVGSIGAFVSLLGIIQWASNKLDLTSTAFLRLTPEAENSMFFIGSYIVVILIVTIKKAKSDIEKQSRTGLSQEDIYRYWREVLKEEQSAISPH